MRATPRHLVLPLLLLLAVAVPSEAAAKRYIMKRDPATGKMRVIDPNESIFSKLARPIMRPVAGTWNSVRNTVFGKPKKPGPGIPGFGGPIGQRSMQARPQSIAQRMETGAARTAGRLGSVAGGKSVGRLASGAVHTVASPLTGSGRSGSSGFNGVGSR